MTQYIIRRVLQSILVILGVVTAVFIITNMTGDPVALMLGEASSAEDIERLREQLGLNEPLYVQYLNFLSDAARGDFQDSLRFGGFSSMEVVLDRYPRTLALAGVALFISVTLGVILGIISAIKRYTVVDNFVMLLALLGQSIPNFWLGIMLILLFAVNLGWFPSQGYSLSPKYLLLPAITLAAPSLARLTRLTRSGMLDVMSADFVRTARAKGLRERIVISRHAFKNTAIPLVTVIGLDFGNLLAGAIITEQIFQWDGVGQLLVTSINSRDFPVVQAATFIIAASFVMINLLVDLIYTWLDPRVRLT
ncbi:MAG TPA: ABC transporter permease [Thermomicrobiales bacterium]|jgi:peptide/nickel transport system permease protein|nr:ABC transporter permease [Thermomicrobiales bacterium]